MKQPTKPTTTDERPKALDVLVGVTEIALAYKYPERTPTLSDMSKLEKRNRRDAVETVRATGKGAQWSGQLSGE